MRNRAEMPEQMMTTWAPEEHSSTSEYISFAKRQRLPAWVYHCAKSKLIALRVWAGISAWLNSPWYMSASDNSTLTCWCLHWNQLQGVVDMTKGGIHQVMVFECNFALGRGARGIRRHGLFWQLRQKWSTGTISPLLDTCGPGPPTATYQCKWRGLLSHKPAL